MAIEQARNFIRILKAFPGYLSGYPLAILVVFVALQATLSVQPYLSVSVPFLAFIAAIMVAAWHSGSRPALFATGLSAVVIDYYLIDSPQSFHITYPDLAALSLFLLVGSFISYFIDHLQKSRQVAMAAQDELKNLYWQSSRLLEKQDLQPMLVQVLNAAIGLLGAEKGVIHLYDEKNGFLCLMAQTGFTDEFTANFRLLPADYSTCGAACLRKRRVIVRDIEADAEFVHFAPVFSHYGVAAVQSTPLFGQDGRVFAVLSTYTSLPHEPSPNSLHLLDLYIRQAQIILQSKYQEEQLRHANEDLESSILMKSGQLVEKEQSLVNLMSELSVTEERERQNLASELHDYLAQLLVLAKLKLRLARRALSKSPVVSECYLDEADEVLQRSIDYARTLMAELCPPQLHEAGLVAGIRWLAQQMPHHGLAVDLDLDSDVILPEETVVLLYRSIRELLINTAKHAQVERATVSLKSGDSGTLILIVEDRGGGFDVASVRGTQEGKHFGLASIRERIAAIGGSIHIDSSPDGTKITLTVPPHFMLPTVPLRAACTSSQDRMMLSVEQSRQQFLPL
jgi:signal transduction histidine kinase